jgi:Glycosyltransferase family 10 (fucosyltransferase) C-term
MTKILLLSNNPNKEAVFNWMKNFSLNYDNNYVYFNNCAFTTRNNETFDGVAVFNYSFQVENIDTIKSNVIAFMQEPGYKIFHLFMFTKLKQYAKVYSPITNSTNTTLSHGYLGWYINKKISDLEKITNEDKKYLASCIASGKIEFKGHRKRLQFVRQLSKTKLPIDYFGFDKYATLPLSQKHEKLIPYKYSIAIENTESNYYFTEKIMDCFVSLTVPFYFGCTNIDQYFPKDSYIWIDIKNPMVAIAIIEKTLADSTDYQKRYNALLMARKLVIQEYHPLAGVSNLINQNVKELPYSNIVLKPNSLTIFQHIYIKLNKFFFNLLYN